MAEKARGLILTLGNAPDTPHVVIHGGHALPGLYRPGQPTVIGGPGELPEAAAREADADPGCPLNLVDIPAGQIDGLRADHQAAVDAARGEAVTFRREAQPDGAEREQVRDLIEATKPARKGGQPD